MAINGLDMSNRDIIRLPRCHRKRNANQFRVPGITGGALGVECKATGVAQAFDEYPQCFLCVDNHGIGLVGIRLIHKQGFALCGAGQAQLAHDFSGRL